MLARLIYVSRSSGPRATDLAHILRTSRTNNARGGLTGALCLLDGVYMQYLEGEERAVEALFAVIERDPRHAQPRVLDRSFIAARAFSGWSMALLVWDERIKAVLRPGSPQAALDLYATPACQAASTFRALARTPNWMAL